VVLVLGWLGAGDALGGVYKWLDEQGRIHYGDSPPLDQPAETVRTPPPPSDEEVLRAQSRLDGIVERDEAARAEAQQREQEAAAGARDEAQRQARCLTARRDLHVLELERPVYRVDEKGNRVFLEDDQRAKELSRARQQVKDHCP
jgi:hypothetical protein